MNKNHEQNLYVLTAVLNEMTCAVSIQLQFVASSASSFSLRFGNVENILNDPDATSSFWLLPSKDVHLNWSVFTLFIYIFIEYFDFVCLHYSH